MPRPSRLRRQKLLLAQTNAIPVYDDSTEPKPPEIASLRAALTRYQTRHGEDALISFLKIELETRGEKRFLLDRLAPHPGQNGQTSLLDSGR